MPAKQIILNDEARQAMGRGVSVVGTAVATTLGPKGRNVVIQSASGPIVTKDGVTVAKHIELEDPYEDLGAQLCKQVSAKTNDVAGDGTTTATVLANAFVTNGLKYIVSGGNPISVKFGMELAAQNAVKIIESLAKPIESKEQITFVATISGNDNEVGQIVADAMEAVGKDGVITIEESRSRETTLALVEGMRIDKGFISPFFVNNPEKMECKHNDVAILLHDGKITDAKDLYNFVQKVHDKLKKPLMIIADSVDGDALQFLVLNAYQGKKPWFAVKSPGFANQKKDHLYDLAALTGAKVLSPDMGTSLESADVDCLGYAKTVISTKEYTTIIEGQGSNDDIEERILQVKALQSQVESDYEARVMSERIARLSGGVAIIRVGASTEAELIEKKYRYEDALAATRAAVEEGIVPGGGVTLLRISQQLDNSFLANEDERIGYDIVKKSLMEPIKQIAFNAGISSDVVVDTICNRENGIGLNARTGEYVDMIQEGIIDPAKVTRSAVQNAVSIAGLVLTTEALIVDKPVTSEKVLVSEGML
jgi:chaperonin GroEL